MEGVAETPSTVTSSADKPVNGTHVITALNSGTIVPPKVVHVTYTTQNHVPQSIASQVIHSSPNHAIHLSPNHAPHPSPNHLPHPNTNHIQHPSPSHLPHPSPTHLPHPSTNHLPHPSPNHIPHPSPNHIPHPSPNHIHQASPNHLPTSPNHANYPPIPNQISQNLSPNHQIPSSQGPPVKSNGQAPNYLSIRRVIPHQVTSHPNSPNHRNQVSVVTSNLMSNRQVVIGSPLLTIRAIPGGQTITPSPKIPRKNLTQVQKTDGQNPPDKALANPEGRDPASMPWVCGNTLVVHYPDDDSSDTDREIKSLDLSAGHVTVREREVRDRERPRPMSWEGELSDTEMTITVTQEEQMRVDVEEPMSPMSPDSQQNSNALNEVNIRHAHPWTELKVEPSSVLPLQQVTRSANDSPVPTRSDSGCEIHPPYTPSQSPLLSRLPTHSPNYSPGASRHVSGFSSPYSYFSGSHTPSTGLSRNNSDASQYGGSYNSYSSAPSPISPTHYSPTQSPNLSRVPPQQFLGPGGGTGIYSTPLDLRETSSHTLNTIIDSPKDNIKDEERSTHTDVTQTSMLAAPSGITRQQLINSPRPICCDKISGFHYGIFSCESCKGFFKRTVQNKKNYACQRGGSCPVTTNTRKKCAACRFEKCLKMGMKLEAIREDRTRGGRSNYTIATFPIPQSIAGPTAGVAQNSMDTSHHISTDGAVKSEPQDTEDGSHSMNHMPRDRPPVPLLLQQIHDVEHLWHCTEDEMAQQRQSEQAARTAMQTNSVDFLTNICQIADNRLYKIVKWCKSLPLFKNISIDDQICLLINSWCELLLLSCCFRSIQTPGEIRVSSGKTMTLVQAEQMGIGPCIERMLNLTYQMRQTKVDKYEYMAMKVIVLLQADVAGLKDSDRVRNSQKKVVEALHEYTRSHYPQASSKFGDLLLRIPELQRTCSASKEMLSMKKKEGDVSSFNFLFELLRGDH